jgi:hypothetical protein
MVFDFCLNKSNALFGVIESSFASSNKPNSNAPSCCATVRFCRGMYIYMSYRHFREAVFLVVGICHFPGDLRGGFWSTVNHRSVDQAKWALVMREVSHCHTREKA